MGAEALRDSVAIIGMGCTRFGALQDKSFAQQGLEAVNEALADAGIEKERIEAAWLGTFDPTVGGSFPGYAGDFIADILGTPGLPVTRVTNYCATGMDALRNAAMAVAAGCYDVVLVVGNEKMRDVPSRDSLIRQVMVTGHPIVQKGLTAPGLFALMARRHMAEYGTTREDLALVAVKNHYNGNRHPKAMFHKELSVEDVLSAPMISEPLGLYDCTPTSDGAAAAVLCRAELAPQFTDEYILIEAIEMATVSGGRYGRRRESLLGFEATQIAARRAYRAAGIADPLRAIDVAEVHDCFTITEILNYEDLGFVPKGHGAAFVREGRSSLEGDLPVNPSGGLKCFGHPIGASGVRMTYIIYEQLLERAGRTQVQVGRNSRGLVHNLGGPGSVCIVGIYHRP
ncbi:MAG: acetyl-CoA acetyltransferase [Ardenticatenia bacterium]|nr:acetyl-CoA acetyltransferase [Ardenticatenia bacterium]